jgi:hypothetical protein
MAIKLLGENETEFSREGIRPSVLVDGCKVSESIWKKKWKDVLQIAICTFSKINII